MSSRACCRLATLRPPVRGRAARPGISSVMAMFYVAMFSGLAIAYTAMTGLNSEITANTRREQQALAAAESGLSVLRYHLSRATFTADKTSQQIFDELGSQLATLFNGTLNVSGQRVTVSSDRISIPEIAIDTALSGAGFAAELTRTQSDYFLTVTGRFSSVRRTVRVRFAEQTGPADLSLLSHGIASQGSLRFDGTTILRSNLPGGSAVMSMDPTSLLPIRVNGSGRFDGDFFMIKEGVTGSQVFSSSNVEFLKADGSGYEGNANAHTFGGVKPPSWPLPDSSPFETLINALPHQRIERGTDIDALGPLHNLYIRANANPTFRSGVNIAGLVYVEWPNDLTFSGSSTITGIIVCQPPPFTPNIGDAATNQITFRGAVTSSGVESLPETAEYAGLRSHTGTFMLAPDCQVTFNGAMGTINGTIYASELNLNGATTGRVRGAILVDRRRQFTKFDSADLFFEISRPVQPPAGLVFERLKILRLVPSSYQEL